MIDWIADYLETLERRPVLSQMEPGALLASLPAEAPEEPTPFKRIADDLDRLIVPGLTHWQSPNFFGYFPANNSYPSILGELLSAGLGVQGMLWSTSPACTELETRVLDWMVTLLGLPESFRSTGTGGGVIQDSASSATLCAMIAARDRATDHAARRTGAGSHLTAYVSEQAHSSFDKAAAICGIGVEHLRKIPIDERFAMRPEALEEAIAADRGAGLTPCFIGATVGTTGSTAMDPLEPIGRIARREGVWLHVDAAFAGAAALCPEFRGMHEGLELADSYCVNPHKWLPVNFDCDCFWVARRDELIRSLSVLPEYLRNRATESGSVIDYRDWQVPLGRRFRALKLWFTLREFGAEKLRRMIRRHVRLARMFADAVSGDCRFELAAPTPLSLVTFRHRQGDEANQAILDRLNAESRIFLTHTRLDGKLTLRLAIGQMRTRGRHVREAWRLIRLAADELDFSEGTRPPHEVEDSPDRSRGEPVPRILTLPIGDGRTAPSNPIETSPGGSVDAEDRSARTE
jgi:aromatic-L-amino-acid decarboxylase